MTKGFNFGDGVFGDPKTIKKPKKTSRRIRTLGFGGGALPESRFLLDNFLGTAGVDVTARFGEIGATWIAHNTGTGNAILNGTGRAYVNGAVFGPMRVANVAPVSNYRVLLTVIRRTANSDFGIGPSGRANSAAPLTWYYFHYTPNTNQFQLYKTVAGVDTVLGSAGYAWPAEEEHVMELKMQGDQITCLFDGAVVIGPVTDASIAGPGRPGFRLFAGGGGGGGAINSGFHAEKIEAYPL
jgi:hypothetical protein